MKSHILINKSKTTAGGDMPVMVVIQEGNRKLQIRTGLTTKTMFKDCVFPDTESNARAKTARLRKILSEVEEYILLHHGETFEVQAAALKEIITGKKPKANTLAGLMEQCASTKLRESTAALYMLTAEKVRKFDPKANLETVTQGWLDNFVRFYNTMNANSIAIHLRNIRAVFNWAIDNELTNKYPFRRYKIKQEKTTINNISVEQLRRLRDYPCEPWQEPYRDLFMLSFYLCGINIGDMLLLKPSNYANGRIVYRRQKTGRPYDIPVPMEAAAIIEKYRGEQYLLFPLDKVADYKAYANRCNHAIKTIGVREKVADKLGKLRKVVYHPILPHITTYTARYTFASLGAELDIPRETIALCLGHAWTDVTSHYIAYDRKKIDEAVKRIVDYVNEG